ASCQAIVTWTAPTTTDNCGAATLTSTHTSGSVFPIGTTPVTYTATDVAGNTSTCTFNVVVEDKTNPIITGCPSTLTATANASCQAVVSWTAPSATDNCGTVTLTSSHTSGSVFPIGTTPVIYTATDGAGNISTCTFNVVVEDKTNPIITGCSSTITATANSSCQAIVTWTAPSATDNYGDATLLSSHTSGSVFLIGTTPAT